MSMKVVEVVIVVLGFLDLLGVSMLVTCLPSHLKSLGVSGIELGLFQSLYGAIQLFSSSMAGHVADRRGRRLVLAVSALCSAVGYCCLALAPSVLLLFLARCITGTFKHTQTLSRAILSSSAESGARDGLMGYFSAVSVLGFIVGPPAGGWLYDRHGFGAVGFVCGILFFVIAGVSLCLVGGDTQGRSHSGRQSKLSFEWIVFRQLWDIYVVQALMASAVMLFRTNFSVTMRTRFDADVATTGLITSSGAVAGVLSGILVGWITQVYGRRYARVLAHVSIVQAVCMAGCAAATSLPTYVLLQLPLSFVNNLARESAFGLTLGRVRATSRGDHHGKIFGISQSINSFCRLGMPFLGSVALELDVRAPAMMGSGFAVAAFFVNVAMMSDKSHIE